MRAKEIPQLNNEQIGRFVSKVSFEIGCWNWKSTKSEKGYGDFSMYSKSYPAHRVSYELFRGQKIPTDMSIDHLCRNRGCVNPFHLEVVTQAENARRGVANKPLKTICIRGHEYSEANTYMYKGNQNCRKCRLFVVKRFKAAKKARPVMTLNPQAVH